MQTQLLFIHSAGSRADGNGSSAFLARLRSGLGEHCRIHAPIMPNPEAPDCADWEAALAARLATMRDGLIIVGHSLGGSVALKYLAENTAPATVRGLFVVAAPYWGADGHWDAEAFRFRDETPRELDD